MSKNNRSLIPQMGQDGDNEVARSIGRLLDEEDFPGAVRETLWASAAIRKRHDRESLVDGVLEQLLLLNKYDLARSLLRDYHTIHRDPEDVSFVASELAVLADYSKESCDLEMARELVMSDRRVCQETRAYVLLQLAEQTRTLTDCEAASSTIRALSDSTTAISYLLRLAVISFDPTEIRRACRLLARLADPDTRRFYVWQVQEAILRFQASSITQMIAWLPTDEARERIVATYNARMIN